MTKKLPVLTALISALLGLVACQGAVTGDQAGVSGPSSEKPGAPVALQFDIDRDATLGADVELRLTVTSASAADSMQISLSADDGLAISPGQATVRFSGIEPGVAEVHTIKVTPQRNGRLYVNVFVTLEQAGRQSVRTFAIPVQVGPEAAQKQAPELKEEDGERIMSLPADES